MSVTMTQRAAGGRTAAKSKTTEVAEQQFPDINTLRNAIPAHCFEPSVAISMGYLVRDLCLISALGWAALTYIPQIPDVYARWAAWAAYGFVQGLFGTGLWILAHEAGHGAFSKHDRFNNIVGWAAHSILMVPYFSWKYSHHRHHRFTGHMEKDMAFVPAQAEDRHARASFFSRMGLDWELFEDAPLFNLVRLISHQLFGWQIYLLFNVTAGKESRQWKGASWFRQSHFEPTSAVFRPSEALFIAISDLGLALMGSAIYYGSTIYGWETMFLLYVVPYMWVHNWLIAITYLHHTHHDVHHYDADNWTFVKGAVATIDRDFGFIDRHLFHGIIGTHVAHHLFPRIPFYYAEEATEAIKPVLGDLYHCDDRNFITTLWHTFTSCKYVVPDPKVPGALKWATN